MPNYVCKKDFFMPLLKGLTHVNGPIFICPFKRYHFWTPKSMRVKEKVQNHASELGHRTSPFITFWYIDLDPVVSREELLNFSEREFCRPKGFQSISREGFSEKVRPPPFFCRNIHELPRSVL